MAEEQFKHLGIFCREHEHFTLLYAYLIHLPLYLHSQDTCIISSINLGISLNIGILPILTTFYLKIHPKLSNDILTHCELVFHLGEGIKFKNADHESCKHSVGLCPTRIAQHLCRRRRLQRYQVLPELERRSYRYSSGTRTKCLHASLARDRLGSWLINPLCPHQPCVFLHTSLQFSIFKDLLKIIAQRHTEPHRAYREPPYLEGAIMPRYSDSKSDDSKRHGKQQVLRYLEFFINDIQ